MSPQRKNRLNRQILAEAAEFFVEFNSGEPDASMRERFDAWLQASPEHVKAYLQLMPIWEDGALRDENSPATAQALIARARAENVAPVTSLESGWKEAPAPTIKRRPYRQVAASIVALLLAAVLAWAYTQRNTYTTGVGELRSIALEDGSTVQLNTRSKLRVRFSGSERRLKLLEGQALFQVVKDPVRPFVVELDETRVRAVGTQFDINKKQAAVVVTVVEGKVAVSHDSAEAPTPLSAGERIMVTEDGVTGPASVDAPNAIAWTRRQLVFDRTPLREVAAEYNRYNIRQIRVKAGELADFHVTGVFSSTDLRPLLRFLEDQPGVQVRETEREIYLSQR